MITLDQHVKKSKFLWLLRVSGSRTCRKASPLEVRKRPPNCISVLVEAELTRLGRRGQPSFEHHGVESRTRDLHRRRRTPHGLTTWSQHPARPRAPASHARRHGFEPASPQLPGPADPAGPTDAEAAAPGPADAPADARTDHLVRIFIHEEADDDGWTRTYEQTP